MPRRSFPAQQIPGKQEMRVQNSLPRAVTPAGEARPCDRDMGQSLGSQGGRGLGPRGWGGTSRALQPLVLFVLVNPGRRFGFTALPGTNTC